MNIKTKLSLGVGLLFLMIVAVTLVNGNYIRVLKNDTADILTANYATLEYVRTMLAELDAPDSGAGLSASLKENLDRQLRNITEPGEAKVTLALRNHYESLRLNPQDDSIRRLMRQDLTEIMQLNMQAIASKSDKALQTAKVATLRIGFTGAICLLIALTLLINLPGNVANPIKELTARIQSIAEQDYSQRVHFGKHGEFAELARSFNTMAEKLEEFKTSNVADLLFEKKRNEALLEKMEEPVIGLDEHATVQFVNGNALQILGLASGDLIGRSAQGIAAENDLMRALLRDVGHEKATTDRRAPIKIYKDGRECFFEKEVVEIRVTPPGETRQKHKGHVIVLKNVTPFKELDFAKTNFIATISHELKTPIASIRMGLQLLEKPAIGPLNKEQAQLLDGIGEDVSRMLKITAELLDMTQIETGNIKLAILPSDPVLILNYAMEAARSSAENKRITLNTLLKGPLPQVLADPEKTAWVLTNLLVNAVRYSPELSRVEICVEPKDARLWFYVRDEGSGIEPRYLEKLFDRYFQVPGSARRGTGLGLAICREFIEAQKGEIGVTSEVGVGSTFFVALPIG